MTPFVGNMRTASQQNSLHGCRSVHVHGCGYHRRGCVHIQTVDSVRQMHSQREPCLQAALLLWASDANGLRDGRAFDELRHSPIVPIQHSRVDIQGGAETQRQTGEYLSNHGQTHFTLPLALARLAISLICLCTSSTYYSHVCTDWPTTGSDMYSGFVWYSCVHLRKQYSHRH